MTRLQLVLEREPKRPEPAHKCSVCGRRGDWGPSWAWYGSDAQLEGGDQIIKTCSKKCMAQAKKDGLVPRNAGFAKEE